MSKLLGGIIGCKDPKKTNKLCLKKNQNAPRPSEHPPVRGEMLFHCVYQRGIQLENGDIFFGSRQHKYYIFKVTATTTT